MNSFDINRLFPSLPIIPGSSCHQTDGRINTLERLTLACVFSCHVNLHGDVFMAGMATFVKERDIMWCIFITLSLFHKGEHTKPKNNYDLCRSQAREEAKCDT